MKTALTLVFGAVVGVVLVYAWQGYQYQRLSFSSESSARVHTDYSVDSQSFYISYERILMVEDVSSGQNYEVAFTPRDDGVVDYRWRSLENGEQDGEGSLFENYEVTEIEIAKSTALVENAGGSLYMSVGTHRLEWSVRSTTGGWVYYNPSLVALSIQATH